MSESIDATRRKLIFGGLTFAVLVQLRKRAFSDELTDLIKVEPQSQIVAVRLWPSSVYTRLTFETSSPIKTRFLLLDNPKRLVIDMYDVKLNGILSALATKVIKDDPIVANVRVAQFNPNTLRVTVLIKKDINLQTKSLNPVSLGKTSYNYRYVLDMYPKHINDTSDINSDDLLAFLIMRDDATTVNTNIPSLRNTQPELRPIRFAPTERGRLLVMLDPGHGGEDPGAIGASGTKEKHIVLDIAKNLHDLINQSDYMICQMTRTQDIFIPLGVRVAMARKRKADIFISIHADAFSASSAHGSSVFVLSANGASSSFARWLAKTQNASDALGGIISPSHDRAVNQALLDMAQTWTLNKSNTLAQKLLKELGSINKLHNGRVEKAAFAVLKAPDIPSALVESAFLSNPEEEARLQSPEFRHKVAQAVYLGIANFAGSVLRT